MAITYNRFTPSSIGAKLEKNSFFNNSIPPEQLAAYAQTTTVLPTTQSTTSWSWYQIAATTGSILASALMPIVLAYEIALPIFHNYFSVLPRDAMNSSKQKTFDTLQNNIRTISANRGVRNAENIELVIKTNIHSNAYVISDAYVDYRFKKPQVFLAENWFQSQCQTFFPYEGEKEGELNGIFSHEIGHIESNHSLKLISLVAIACITEAAINQIQERYYYYPSEEMTYWEQFKNLFTLQNLAFTGIKTTLLAGTCLSALYMMRQFEFEADFKACDTLAHAKGLHSFLNKLSSSHYASPSFFDMILSTHPPTTERVKRIEGYINSGTLV